MSGGFGECGFGGVEGFGDTGLVDETAETPTVSSNPAESTRPIDLLLDSDGDLVIDSDVHFSTGVNAVAQGIRIRLQNFKGEWFLDLDDGVPYYQDILGQKYDQNKVRDAFRDAILATPGVEELLKLEVSFDGQTRTLSVEWEVRAATGTIEESLELEV